MTTSEVDWRAILKRYMDTVGMAEGIYYIRYYMESDEDRKLLQEIADEIDREWEEKNAAGN